MNTLRIESLSKTYSNGVQALNNISLSIENGMYGLLGANGAGKSSLMRTIATLQEPTEGTIEFNEIDVVKSPQQIRNQLGYLPQEFGVYPRVSAEKLLTHMAVLKGIANASDRKKQVTTLLQQTNLYQHRKKAVYTFSGGMRQRFGIAQALLGNPQLVIVDEPTAGLDPEERSRFLNLLSEIGENVVVLLSTHIVEDVYNLCSQMAILSNGEILTEGNPTKLINGIKGQIWTKTINKFELAQYQEQYSVISTKLISGQTQIQVLANTQPGAGFDEKIPTLEDYYFSSVYNFQNVKAKQS